MEKLIIAAILTVLLIGAALAQDLSGPLSGTLGPGSYNVVGLIEVQAGDTLILAPGTTFRFTGAWSFTVLGNLQAIGAAVDSIKFVRSSTVSWNGLDFANPTCSGSVLAYCVVNGSGCQGISCQNGASIALRHCLISANEAGSS